MKSRILTILPCLAILVSVCCGCKKSQLYVSEPRLDKGLVIVLPGIEGRSMLNESICKGLDEGGVNWAIEIDDWTAGGGFNALFNLRAEQRNHKTAKRLVGKIVKYQRDYPGRPVVIVGHSGGGAMAVWMAEELPLNTAIRGLVLINVSLSREYNLCEAFRHTSAGIVSFYSPKDYILLGAGTTLFATMDGKHEVSAGMKGFIVPTSLPKAYDQKLFQIEWDPRMSYQTGHSGGHFSSSDNEFIARYVSPFVLSEQWSKKFADEVKTHDMRQIFSSPEDIYENTIKEDCGLGE